MVDESNTAHPFFVRVSCGQVARTKDDIVVIRFLDGVQMGAENTRELRDAIMAAAQGRAVRVIADIRGRDSSDRQARQIAREPASAALIARMAILVNSPVTRVIANFFARATKPPYPLQVFDSEAYAVRWLLDSGVS